MLLTMTVLAVLAGLAAPGMGRFLVRHRMATIANDMLSLAIIARREALHRGARVTLCRSTTTHTDMPQCAPPGTSWQDGALVFVDDGLTNPPQPAQRAALLRVRGPISNGYRLERRGLNSAAVSFAPSGRLKSGTLGVSFDIGAPVDGGTGLPMEQRCFLIATTGRARIDEQACE